MGYSGLLFPFPAGDAALYESLKEHILSDDMLRKNNYPLQHPDRAGCAVQCGESRKTMADGRSTAAVGQLQQPLRHLMNKEYRSMY